MKASPVFWSIIQQFGRQGVNFIIFILLAVWLRPEAFGILSAAMLWLTFMAVFTELGFGAALIQAKQLELGAPSSTFFLNISLGLFLCLIGIICSRPLAYLVGTLDAQPIIAVLSLSFIFDSFSLTQIALAQRELRFRDLAIRDIIAALIGGIIGLVLAYKGYGVWSLVAQTLLTSIIEAILIWRLSEWRPHLYEFSFDCVRNLWGYSSRIFAFNLFKYAVQNADKFLISLLLGSVVLGTYTFAYRLVIFPVSSLIGAIGSYLFPKFSRHQDDSEMLRFYYLLVIQVANALIIPAMIMIGLLAPILIPVVFGDQWKTSTPLVQLFTMVAVLQALISPSGQLMKALNRPGWLFKWSVLFTFITVLCLWFGSYWGTFGIGIGIVVAHLIALPIMHWINVKLIAVNVLMMIKVLLTTIIPAICMGVIFWFVLKQPIAADSLRIIGGFLLSSLFYIIMFMWVDKKFADQKLFQLAKANLISLSTIRMHNKGI